MGQCGQQTHRLLGAHEIVQHPGGQARGRVFKQVLGVHGNAPVGMVFLSFLLHLIKNDIY